MPVKPSYLVLAGGGVLVAVAGIKGWGLSQAFRDLVSGKNPAANPQLTNQITGAVFGYGYGTGTAIGPGSVGGIQLASIAESHIGFPYTWGGAPANGSTDCSGFANMCIGHDARLSIPGYRNGSYPWTTHGPNTLLWLAWLGTGISRVPRNLVQPGDLAIWQTHMGIIVDGQNMVSDLNPSLGTRKTGIEAGGPAGEILVCARLRQLVSLPSGGGGGGKHPHN